MTIEQLQAELEELEALNKSGKDYARVEIRARELLNVLALMKDKSVVESGSLSVVEAGSLSVVEAGSLSVVEAGSLSVVEAGSLSVVEAGILSRFPHR